VAHLKINISGEASATEESKTTCDEGKGEETSYSKKKKEAFWPKNGGVISLKTNDRKGMEQGRSLSHQNGDADFKKGGRRANFKKKKDEQLALQGLRKTRRPVWATQKVVELLKGGVRV